MRSDVLATYGEGVDALRAAVEGWSDGEWQREVCGRWTATDLAGHLLAVIGWYHSWLDRAESGDARPPFGVADLPERNRLALIDLRPADGRDRIALFAEEAGRYAERLTSSWALPYGCPLGTMPAGSHAAVAAGEWHLHAWDLSGGTHRPGDATFLLVAIIRARATARSGLRARVESAVAPLVAAHRPWERLLEASGRRAPAAHRVRGAP
jgi:hypothetical protein